MKPKRLTIGEGIYLNILECDKFKTNCISVDFLCRTEKDSAAKAALLPFVLTRGTAKHPGMKELTAELDMLYGSHISGHVSKIGDIQYFGFTSYPLISEYAENTDVTAGVFDIIGEMINSPRKENGKLYAPYVEGEKALMIDRIRAKINDKNSYSVLRCREEMTEGEPYSIPETGYEEDVAAITPDDLTDYLEYAKNELRIEIWCVGIFDSEKLTEQLKGIFGFENRKTPAPLTHERTEFRGSVKKIDEPQPVNQGKLCLGFRTGTYINDIDASAFTVFCEILGGSPMSKLFMNVREKLSLCYYCQAVSDNAKGIMLIASGIEVKNKDLAISAITKQIDACKNGEISDQELSAAKKSILNSAKTLYDDAEAMKSWYMRRGLFGIGESPEEYCEKAMKICISDIEAVAKKLILDTEYFLNGTLLDEGGEERE